MISFQLTKSVMVQNYEVEEFQFLKKVYQGTAKKIEVNQCIC